MGSAFFFFFLQIVAETSKKQSRHSNVISGTQQHGPIVEEKLFLLRAKLQGQDSFCQSQNAGTQMAECAVQLCSSTNALYKTLS